MRPDRAAPPPTGAVGLETPGVLQGWKTRTWHNRSARNSSRAPTRQRPGSPATNAAALLSQRSSVLRRIREGAAAPRRLADRVPRPPCRAPARRRRDPWAARIRSTPGGQRYWDRASTCAGTHRPEVSSSPAKGTRGRPARPVALGPRRTPGCAPARVPCLARTVSVGGASGACRRRVDAFPLP